MFKAAVYQTIIIPVLMFGSETWVLRKAGQNLLERTEMRMLRWMMGIKRMEKIRNENIRERTGVANIIEEIREARLGWLSNEEKKTEHDAIMRRWKWMDTDRLEGRN